MLDIGGDELLLTAFVAIVVIGPKELPRAMLFAGKWIGKARRMSGAFRAGLESFVQESEIRDLETDWASKRETILAQFAALEGSSPASLLHAESVSHDQSCDNSSFSAEEAVCGTSLKALGTVPPRRLAYGTIQSPSADTPPTSSRSSLTT